MGDLTARDRVPEGTRDVLLTDDGGESLGAVAAIESGALGHWSRILTALPACEDQATRHSFGS